MSAPADSDEPASVGLEDARGAASGSRRMIVGVILGLGLVAAVVVLFVWRRATGLPPTEREARQDVREALDQAGALPPDLRRALAAQAVVELEGERLPAGLLAAFDEFDSVPAGMADMILLAPFAEDQEVLETWLLACSDGADALAEAMTTRGGAPGLYERCRLGRLGLLAPTELGGVSTGQLVATHAAWAHLLEHGSESELERRVFRMLLGRG